MPSLCNIARRQARLLWVPWVLARILALLAVALLGDAQAEISADGRPITPAYVQEVLDAINGAAVDANAPEFELSPDKLDGTETTMEGIIGKTASPEMGGSQKQVIHSLFAMAASMNKATSIKNIFQGSTPISQDGKEPQVGILSGWVIVPLLLKAFVSMDIFLSKFFSASLIFSLLCMLIIMMGVAILRQMAQNKLDVVSWTLKSIFAVLVMFKANMICNYFMAVMFSIAAMINSSLVNGIVSEAGMNDWYLKVYGPQLTRGCYGIITGQAEGAALARPFDEPRDMYNISRYVMNEGGRDAAIQLTKYLGGYQGYNQTAGGKGEVAGGYNLKALSATYCLMVVYNIGMQNLYGRIRNGYAQGEVNMDMKLFRLEIAKLRTGNDALTVDQQALIDKACGEIELGDPQNSAQPWQYLVNAKDAALNDLATKYFQPPKDLTYDALKNVAVSTSSIASKITGFLGAMWDKAASAVSTISWLPSSIFTFITQGALQIFLLGGMLLWILLSIALCKLGVVMVVLTSPLIMTETTSKYFWGTFKAMLYPAIYPPMLIVLMQLTSALASWFGTMSGLMAGLGLILNIIPLVFGLVTVIFLPKIVKAALTGGSVIMAQLGGAAKVAGMAAGAVVGAGAFLGAGAAAGAAAGGAGGVGSGGAAAGGAMARASLGSRILGGLQRGGSAVMNTRIPGSSGMTVGGAALAGSGAGIPGMIYAAARRKKAQKPPPKWSAEI